MSDLRQSKEWSAYMKDIGWQVETLEYGFAYIRKLGMLGSIIKVPRLNPPIHFNSLDKLAKKHRALLVKLEPNVFEGSNIPDLLKKNNFYLDNWSFAPTKTIVIDLSDSLEDIQSRMVKDTRYAIRKAQENQLEVKIDNTKLDHFLEIYRETAKRAGFWVGSETELLSRWEIFNKSGKGDLFLVYKGNQIVAGSIVLYQDIYAYYYHAGSTREAQKLNAPSLLIWEIIKEAKRRKCKLLDLEGIVDPRVPSTKNWKGFSAFKRSFGGHEVSYIGSFSKYYIPFVGPIFRLIQKLGV